MSDPVEIQVLNHSVRLLQPAEGFRTSLDSVMVAAACPAAGGERVADLGCGVGGAGFCVARRVAGVMVTGFDKERDYIELAHKNAGLNGDLQIGFEIADIRFLNRDNGMPGFDQVLCNPPFLEGGKYTPSPAPLRAAALGHMDQETTLKDWLDASFRLLKPGGHLTLIHRADAVDRIVIGLGKRFGEMEIIPLWPRAGEAAKRVVMRARKDRRGPARLLPGLVLHEADGSYTAAADRILRDGEGLAVG